MDLVRKQQQDKETKQAVALSVKYRDSLKIYQQGLALQSAKKIDEWTSSNYYTMIKFKQLDKEDMPALPTNLTRRKQRWFGVCQHMEDPSPPTCPDNYVEEAAPPQASLGQLSTTVRGDSDDEMSELSFEMFAV